MGAETPSAKDVEKFSVVSLTRGYLPEAISLADRFPLPGNQLETGTCVAWATAYAARSYYSVALANSTNRPQGDEIASPAFAQLDVLEQYQAGYRQTM